MNTGEIVAGQARAGSSFVTGDAVNVAARLEQAATPGTTVVGARTAEAVRGAFELGPFRNRRERQVRAGHGADARPRADADAAARPPRRRASFRRPGTELDLLQAIFRHAVEQSEPHVVTLMGDAGVGKTTLVQELWRWLDDQEPQPVQRIGRCLAYGHLTYWALGEILREHLGILESESEDEVRRRLGDREMLGLALGLDLTGDAHPLAVRDRFQEAWVEFLTELTAEAPTVMLVEDLHWAEDPLLDLLERVCRDVRGPLLVIGTARAELLDRRRSWGGGRRNASLVWLDALSPVEAAEMLDELVPGELSSETRRALVERAEGNPFFLEELLARLPRDRHRRGGAAGLGSGDPLGPRRQTRERRQGGASGGVGHRPCLLERADTGARRRRARRVAATGGAQLHPPAADLLDRRRDGVLVQARADARGGLRQRSQGAAREAPRPDRCLARAYGQRA